jgi:hypothetical protein
MNKPSATAISPPQYHPMELRGRQRHRPARLALRSIAGRVHRVCIPYFGRSRDPDRPKATALRAGRDYILDPRGKYFQVASIDHLS